MIFKTMLHPIHANGLRAQRIEIENNIAGFISFSRVAELMRQTGELKNSETIEAFVLTDDGIQYFVKRR